MGPHAFSIVLYSNCNLLCAGVLKIIEESAEEGGRGRGRGELRVIITIIFHSLLQDADSGSEINLSGFKFSLLKKCKIFYSREIYKS